MRQFYKKIIYKKHHIFKLTKWITGKMTQHPPSKYWWKYHVPPKTFPPHTYQGNFFQHLLLWGLESSELEAEVKKERLEDEPWHQPHTRSSPEILQQGDTIALKFKLQQTIRKESNQNMINDGILLLFEK